MAKRDKLYTVNKWNRPFFEQERRKKLYGIGGSTDNYVWGLNTDQGLTRAGIAQAPVDAGWKRNMPGWASNGQQASNPWREMVTTYAAVPTENATPAGNLNQQDTNASNGSNNSKLRMIQDAAIAARDFASGIQSVNKLADLGKPVSNPTQISSSPSTGLFGDTGFGARTTVFTETPYTPSTSTVFNNVLNPRTLSQNIISPKTLDYTLQGASGFSNTADNFQKTIGYYLQTNPQSDFAKSVVLNNVANSKITQPSLIEGYTPKVQTSGISDLGKAGVGIGASVLGEVGGNLISDGFNTVPGTLINQIGSTAGSVISMIPGVGWWVGPAITFGSKLLGGVYNRAFGSEYKDNGATAYTNQLNALNPNGSNEYLANLLASTGVGPRATSRNGWFNHSAERRADRTNTAQDLAFNRFQRGVRDAFGNNNWKQLQYALNDYTTYGAMGGRIKRKKCNCKATGGFLNNALLDSASATGYNFLSDLTNMQMQNNQNKQDMSSSLGNSFTGLSNGTLFANGGGININPAHKGEFTAKAKRHGMGVQQFANYVLAHKDKFPTSTIRQAVFAKNSNTWKKAFGGKLNYGKDKDIRYSGFFDGQTLYAIGGPLQAMSSNWSPGGNVTEINAGGQHEENPYEGVQVGVDPEGTPNLVEENEVIWNDYVFSNRLKVPKEVCKELRVGQKKDGFTFAEVAKKLLKESKERPNDPISKRGLDANMQKLEDAQEELKQKMEAEEAVEQFNSLPPEQQVAIMQQEGEKAQDAVAQEQMAQQIQNLPPEQQQAIAQQMAMEQAQQQGMPQQGMSPEEQYAMQQQAVQDQYAAQRDARNQEVLAQAAAMQDQAINSSAMGGKLYQSGGKKYIKGAKSHWETNAQGHRVLVPNTPFENTGFGGGRFGMAGGGAEWGDEPAPLAPKKRDWLAIDYKESFNDAYRKARKEKKKTFWFDGKEYSTDYNPNLTEEQVRQGMNRYQDKGLIIAPWEHAYGGPLCFGGKLFAEGGELNGQPQAEPRATQQDTEMAKYSDEELQDMIDDYQEAESGEVKVTKGKLARLRKKAEKAQAELERRHSEENEEQHQEARQEPTQEELQAAAQEQAMQAQQPIEGQPQEGMPQEGMSPEQAMMMQQQMGGQPQMSPEEMAAAELQQQGNGQYAYGGRVNKFAYAGPLKPQPIGPGITREVQEPYKRHPDIPQEVYDWFLSLTPEERFDLFGSSPMLNMNLKNYGTDSWYDRNKPIPDQESSSRWWSQYVTTAKGEESRYMRQAILDAYKNRRDSDGKYIPYNLSQDIINWYATLPENERKKIVANTKMNGKDFATTIRYANTGSPKAVANAITEAYNAANGQTPVSAQTSDVTSIAANTPTNVSMPIYSGQSTTGANLMKLLGFKSTKDAPITLDELGIKSWNDKVDPSKVKRETLEKATNPVIKHLLNLGWSPFYNGPTEDQWWENSGGAEINFSDAGAYNKGYTKEDVNKLAKRYPQVRWALENNADFINNAYKDGRISGKDLIKAFENSPMWTSTNDYLFNSPDALQHQLNYLARRRQYDTGNQDSRFLNTWREFGDFIQDPATGKWSYKLKEGVDPNKFTEKFRNLRNDGKFGTMYDVRQIPTQNAINYVLDENGNPTEEIIFDTNGYTQVGNPYIYYSANADDPLSPGVNNTISYWKKNSSNTNSSVTDDESNYLTVGWKPKMDWTGLALGVAPGLTGLAMQLGRGAPDMSELDKAVAAYERNTGTMVAPHLTHGLIRPAIIDPRVTENSLNARRLGTNRLLMNTGSTPSRGATILANDANTIGQLGQAMINNWRENRQQEQAAAAFNRETNTTNANILNQVDQFNAQTQSALARDAAQLRYNVAKDKIAARDAYYAGLMGNLGSVFKGGYEAWRENQRKNERDLLAASGVFGETNSLIDDWLGISKVDPKTHKVVRGYNTGMYYWINPNTGKAEYLKTPPLATTPINACGGKIKKNKKRKGYTF